MGGLKEKLSQRTMEITGKSLYKLRARLADEFWRILGEHMQKMDVQDVMIYQDGLPAVDEEVNRIVEQAVEKGSRNYKLLKTLKERGAVIVGTEDPNLLKREYEIIKALLETSKKVDYRKMAELLEARDKFIAKRIDETLPDGGRGILFIGAIHKVENYLPEDIEINKIRI